MNDKIRHVDTIVTIKPDGSLVVTEKSKLNISVLKDEAAIVGKLRSNYKSW